MRLRRALVMAETEELLDPSGLLLCQGLVKLGLSGFLLNVSHAGRTKQRDTHNLLKEADADSLVLQHCAGPSGMLEVHVSHGEVENS